LKELSQVIVWKVTIIYLWVHADARLDVGEKSIIF
jgi:hypothetical protein